MQKQLFLGEHYIAEFYDCSFNLLNDPQILQNAFLKCAQACNATIICSKFHKFNPFGVSGVVVIAQSHLTIHTWPEYKYAAIDVFTCSKKMRSGRCVQILSQSLKCLNYQESYIPRGYVNKLHLMPQQLQKQKQNFISFSNLQKANRQKYFQQSYIYQQGIFSRFGIPYEKVLQNKKSKFQQIKIVESSTVGKTLLLDGVFMICEKTEANYHEMMVHPMVQILLEKGKQLLKVLIIGGGDGGAARQLLRYPQVNCVKVCQLDDQVIQACRRHIPQTAHSFDNPRVQIYVSDGLEYVAETQDKWDLIFCDGCDPIAEGFNLFLNEFYQNCYRILNDDGIFLTQGQSIHSYKDQFLGTAKNLKQVFGCGNSSLLFYHQPIYEFGLWAFQMGIKTQKGKLCDLKAFSRKQLNESKVDQFVDTHNLKYYNYDMHLASFAIPNEIQILLKQI